MGLVHSEIVKPDVPDGNGRSYQFSVLSYFIFIAVPDATAGLTEEKWKQLQDAGDIDMKEIYRLVYFGGMAHPLRKKLWPLMLSGKIEGEDPDKLRREYEDRMSEWLAVEAIVRQKDRETMATNMAKLSSEGTISEANPPPLPPPPGLLQTHESNEVRLGSMYFANSGEIG